MCTHKGICFRKTFFLSFLFQLIFLYLSRGELAQLARASALQAEGQGFEPPILQENRKKHEVFSREVL